MIGKDLKEAKENGYKKYYNKCKKHGIQTFAVLDNSCPVCVNEARQRRHKNNYSYNRYRGHYNEIKRRAREKGHQFDLDLNWLRQRLSEAVFCPYLEVRLNQTQDDCKANPDCNKSVDRINPNKGYTKDNVIICSNKANRIKNNASVIELKLLYENMQKILQNT